MNIVIYAFSTKGAKLCDKIIESLKEHNIEALVPEKYVSYGIHVKPRTDNLYASVEEAFKTKDSIIFIGATGIAVRGIAPFVRSKSTDPAVICIDERGINVISLLSGHIGGANELTLEIADIIGGRPIITTATDINNKLSIDEWAVNHNLHILNLKVVRDISADILEDRKIGFHSDFKVSGEVLEEIDLQEKKIGFCISLDPMKKPFRNTLNLIPKIVSVGIGCRKGVDYKIIHDALLTVLQQNNISHFAIKSLNSIDLKKNEEGIIETAKILEVPFNTYAQEGLNKIEGKFSESNFVKKIAGVDSVCERAAIMGSVSKKLIIRKTIVNSVTIAVAIDDYIVDFNCKSKIWRKNGQDKICGTK